MVSKGEGVNLSLPAASEHAGLVVVLGEGGDEPEQLLHRLDRLGILLSPPCRELEVRHQRSGTQNHHQELPG